LFFVNLHIANRSNNLFHNYGPQLKMMAEMNTVSLSVVEVQRLKNLVEQKSGGAGAAGACRLWVGEHDRYGYGVLRATVAGKRIHFLAHRLALFFVNLHIANRSNNLFHNYGPQLKMMAEMNTVSLSVVEGVDVVLAVRTDSAPTPAAIQRLKNLVEQKSGGAGAAGACRLWVGEHDRYGYGVLRATVAGKRIHFLAHRLALFFVNLHIANRSNNLFHNYGPQLKMMAEMNTVSLSVVEVQRLKNLVEQKSGGAGAAGACRLWVGEHDRYGYGVLRATVAGKRIHFLAHRLALFFVNLHIANRSNNLFHNYGPQLKMMAEMNTVSLSVVEGVDVVLAVRTDSAPTPAAIQRLKNLVEQKSGGAGAAGACRLWVGEHDRYGYGVLRATVAGKRIHFLAHRLALFFVNLHIANRSNNLFHNYGPQLKMMAEMNTVSLSVVEVQRLKNLVEQKSGGAGAAGACRLWVGEHDRYGYGVLRATVAGKRIHFLAHRLALFFVNLHIANRSNNLFHNYGPQLKMMAEMNTVSLSVVEGVDVVLAVRTDSAPTPAAIQRLKNLVEQKSGGAGAAGACRLWVGEHDRYGYGVLRATVAGKRIHFLAHRLALFFVNLHIANRSNNLFHNYGPQLKMMAEMNTVSLSVVEVQRLKNLVEQKSGGAGAAGACRLWVGEHDRYGYGVLRATVAGKRIHFLAHRLALFFVNLHIANRSNNLFHNYGPQLKMMAEMNTVSLSVVEVQRLKNLVEQKSGGAGAAGACRLWVGEHDRYGYGVLRATVAGKRIHFLAHRLALFFVNLHIANRSNNLFHNYGPQLKMMAEMNTVSLSVVEGVDVVLAVRTDSAPTPAAIQRLKNLVEQKSGGAGAAGACRLWVGEHDRYGYGVLRATVAGKRIHFLAHRLALFFVNLHIANRSNNLFHNYGPQLKMMAEMNTVSLSVVEGVDVVLAVRTDSAPTPAAIQRLKNLVEQKSGGAGAAGACRLWVGEHDRYGYGVLRATVAGKRIHFLAHRLALFFVNLHIANRSNNLFHNYGPQLKMMAEMNTVSLSVVEVQRLKILVEQKSGGAGAAGACRLWVGEHDRYGYGVLRATVAGKRIHFLAHRLAFFLHFLGVDVVLAVRTDSAPTPAASSRFVKNCSVPPKHMRQLDSLGQLRISQGNR
ncbi:hypothetical protein DPMN_058181, partial [Dreissena polymorpha]